MSPTTIPSRGSSDRFGALGLLLCLGVWGASPAASLPIDLTVEIEMPVEVEPVDADE